MGGWEYNSGVSAIISSPIQSQGGCMICSAYPLAQVYCRTSPCHAVPPWFTPHPGSADWCSAWIQQHKWQRRRILSWKPPCFFSSRGQGPGFPTWHSQSHHPHHVAHRSCDARSGSIGGTTSSRELQHGLQVNKLFRQDVDLNPCQGWRCRDQVIQ